MSLMESLGIDRLSAEDRWRLLDEIAESLAEAPEAVTLSDAHREHLLRRLNAYRDDPKAGSSWDEVKARLHEEAV